MIADLFNPAAANSAVRSVLTVARMHATNGTGMSDFAQGMMIGQVISLEIYAGAEDWICDGAKNEISYLARRGAN